MAQIETAVNISRRMHLAAMTHARAGMTEAELMALVARESFAAGCVPAYGIILSVRGEVLHNVSYHNVLQPGQMLLCDAGSESPMHYAGDITRAFPIDATFGTRQKEIYQVVLDTQLEAIHALKPGVSYRDIHHLAALKMTEGLRQLGLMKGDPEEAVQQGAHALFFPHGLGHMLGLDVHDMEDLGEKHVGYGPDLERSTQFGTQYLRLARKLESGFVLTVEPGCYFIPALIDQWQAEGKYESFINYDRLSSYRDFGGVRIEDNYLITDTGARLLGEAIPKTVAEVEVMRQG
ncbi:MAG: Xaa-Pro dipeptidase [Bacteroidetes bacterium]|nr:MAG: Xaa-Pro dipeptidase [Bacteroidota bacterium]